MSEVYLLKFQPLFANVTNKYNICKQRKVIMDKKVVVVWVKNCSEKYFSINDCTSVVIKSNNRLIIEHSNKTICMPMDNVVLIDSDIKIQQEW